MSVMCYFFGMFGILFEPLPKHSQYVGFYFPKFVEYFTKIVFGNRLKVSTFVLVVLLSGLIGLAHSRGHYEKTSG